MTPVKRRRANAHPLTKRTEGIAWHVERIPTQLWSFKQATGGGLPRYTLTEVAGYTYVGKSTLLYYLCAEADPTGRIAICPLEATDQDYVERATAMAGHSGKIWYAPSVDDKGKPSSDEDMLDAFLEKIQTEETIHAGMLDAVGSISPISEFEGRVEEANMGRRALIMGRFMRKSERILLRWRRTPCNIFLANHLHPNIGVMGSSTSGGKSIENHAATRIRLSVAERFEEGSWIVEPALLQDVFTEEPDSLWSDVLKRKGGPFGVLALMPPDPSAN